MGAVTVVDLGILMQESTTANLGLKQWHKLVKLMTLMGNILEETILFFSTKCTSH
jgi:hypothetical protein